MGRLIAPVAQWIRAFACGAKGRVFESRLGRHVIIMNPLPVGISLVRGFQSKESMKSLQILLTNDDGILSPGLWAAAAALSELGYVHVVAPREQSSGMGRSLPSTSDGAIHRHEVVVNGN